MRVGDLVLGPSDISTLLPGNWLNDQAIEFALLRFEELANRSGRCGCVFVPPSTTQLFLHAPDIAPGIAHDLKLDPSRGKPILFCLNNASDLSRPLSGTHWSALVVAPTAVGSTVHVHYDSLNGINDHIAEQLSANLKAILGDAELIHERSFNGRQKNQSDCGVFLLAVAHAYIDVGEAGQEVLDQRVDAIDTRLVQGLRQELLDAVNDEQR